MGTKHRCHVHAHALHGPNVALGVVEQGTTAPAINVPAPFLLVLFLLDAGQDAVAAAHFFHGMGPSMFAVRLVLFLLFSARFARAMGV